MFAFAESLKRQEMKLISPNVNLSLLSKATAPISDNMRQPCTIQLCWPLKRPLAHIQAVL